MIREESEEHGGVPFEPVVERTHACVRERVCVSVCVRTVSVGRGRRREKEDVAVLPFHLQLVFTKNSVKVSVSQYVRYDSVPKLVSFPV